MRRFAFLLAVACLEQPSRRRSSAVRFLRDSAGRVNELGIGESRVWDLRFRRKSAHPVR